MSNTLEKLKNVWFGYKGFLTNEETKEFAKIVLHELSEDDLCKLVDELSDEVN